MKKTLCAIYVIAVSLISINLLHAGSPPSIDPSPKAYVGVGKDLNVSASGGSSDDPDYDAPCPPWTIVADTEIWTWTVNGPATILGSGPAITLTGTSVGDVSVTVNKNDEYKDKSTPPVQDNGTPSAESAPPLRVHVLEAKAADEKKWYYFEHPQLPAPYDAEEKELS